MLKDKILSAVKAIASQENWPDGVKESDFVVEEPRDPSFGQLATNAAMTMAKASGHKPRDLAKLIIAQIADPDGFIDSMEIAGPGFINFRLSSVWWAKALKAIRAAGPDYGRRKPSGRRVQVEFVSANPTGPLHVGHGRGAALGDAVARILTFQGDDVEREYYINDAGRQMNILGLSVLIKLEQSKGLDPQIPEDFYRGDYINQIALDIQPSLGDNFDCLPREEKIGRLSDIAGRLILDGIKKDLTDFRVSHDTWFSEKSLYQTGAIEKAIKELKDNGHIYNSEGAVWFKTTALGDDKDRVLIKNDGSQTYFAGDIAYHRDKLARGFETMIDIWGADHHGYIQRMKAAVEALGKDRENLSIILVQLVNLLRDGQLVSMSTRGGEFVTLREVLDEVGADAARFIFLTRSHDSTLDFDLELAKAQTRDNPVYYVQYVCARIHSLISKAELGGAIGDPNLLTQPEELELIKHLAAFPDNLESAAKRLEPHLVTVYLTTLAKLFHQYYAVHRLIVDGDPNLTASRVELAAAVRQVTVIGLDLLGVSAPEKM
ncbi:MAG: arginine--tRNA ligase [Deltaproteobacteria bacterium]|jgi:arginyl-tRNA synthetase|nr:arginine--tRNA ligase [Deltaproteobacteria bacterium]